MSGGGDPARAAAGSAGRRTCDPAGDTDAAASAPCHCPVSDRTREPGMSSSIRPADALREASPARPEPAAAAVPDAASAAAGQPAKPASGGGLAGTMDAEATMDASATGSPVEPAAGAPAFGTVPAGTGTSAPPEASRPGSGMPSRSGRPVWRGDDPSPSSLRIGPGRGFPRPARISSGRQPAVTAAVGPAAARPASPGLATGPECPSAGAGCPVTSCAAAPWRTDRSAAGGMTLAQTAMPTCGASGERVAARPALPSCGGPSKSEANPSGSGPTG
jgi:hypothetical protein